MATKWILQSLPTAIHKKAAHADASKEMRASCILLTRQHNCQPFWTWQIAQEHKLHKTIDYCGSYLRQIMLSCYTCSTALAGSCSETIQISMQENKAMFLKE